MNDALILSGYRPVYLIVVGLALVVLLVIGGQVLGLIRHNRHHRVGRTPRASHRPPAGQDDAEPWRIGLTTGRRA